MQRAVVQAALAAAVAVASASATARPPPTLALAPVWKSGKVVRLAVHGRNWVVSAERADVIPVPYKLRALQQLSRRLPMLRMRERCVSAAGGVKRSRPPHRCGSAS